MTPKLRLPILFAALAGFLAAEATAQSRPELLQQVGGFHKPTSAVFSPDSKYLYVINHAQGESGTLRNESFLSKLSVDDTGKVEADDMRFVHSLTAPVDLDFSPVRFGKIPEGALFLAMGTPLVQDEAGRTLKDVSRVMVGLMIIDPRTGRTIKVLDLSPNADGILGKDRALLAPSSLCFDSDGTLYIGESGIGGAMFPNRKAGRPGIWRLEAEAVRDLLTGVVPTKIELIRTTSLPVDMAYREKENMIYFATNHSQGAPSGSIMKVTSEKFEGIGSIQVLVRGIGALSGLEITPKGRVLMVGNNGDLMFPKGKKNFRSIRFRPRTDFSTPGKIGLTVLKDRSILIAVPEQSSEMGSGEGQRVSIVKLPDNY